MDNGTLSTQRRRKTVSSRFRYRWRTGVVTIAIVGTVLTISTITWQVIRGWREQREAARLALRYHLMTAAAMMFDQVAWGSLYMSTAVTAPVFITKAQDDQRTPHSPFGTPSLTITDLERLVDSAFLAKRIGNDSSRGYFRLTVRNRQPVPGSFQTSGAMRHQEFQEVIYKKIREDEDFIGPARPTPMLFSERPRSSQPIMFAIARVWGHDSTEVVLFGVTYARAGIISHYGNTTYENINLLPSNFNGVDWITAQRIVHDSLLRQSNRPFLKFDSPEALGNNKLISLRIFDTDINVTSTLLYTTPKVPSEVWTSPYVVEYAMPSMGLLIHAAITEEQGNKLVAAVVPLEAEQRLLAGIILLGIFFIGAALMELRRQRQLVRTRADFVSSISHELRTPLAHVSTLSETLYRGGAESPEQEERWLRAIHREAQRLGTMVENILLFARGEREHLRISRHPADVAEIIRDVTSIVEPFAVSRSARVCIQSPPIYHASVDARAVRQVLLNLLDNAIKYGPTTGQTITVTLVPQPKHNVTHEAGNHTERNGESDTGGDDVTIIIDDQGPGIPLHQRDQIWSPFVRLDNESNLRGETGGSGLGLNVVRTLVEQHGGITRIADSPDGGARFIVTFSPVEGSVGGVPRGILHQLWPVWLRQIASLRTRP